MLLLFFVTKLSSGPFPISPTWRAWCTCGMQKNRTKNISRPNGSLRNVHRKLKIRIFFLENFDFNYKFHVEKTSHLPCEYEPNRSIILVYWYISWRSPVLTSLTGERGRSDGTRQEIATGRRGNRCLLFLHNSVQFCKVMRTSAPWLGKKAWWWLSVKRSHSSHTLHSTWWPPC